MVDINILMSIYLLLVPLAPIFIPSVSQSLDRHSYLAISLSAFFAFIPAAVLSTILRNLFVIEQLAFSTHVMRFFLSDYCVQLFWLLGMLIILIHTLKARIARVDVGGAILLFCCWYFFAESLYRLLFISVTANAYALFVFPTVRLTLIMSIQMLMARFHTGKQIIIPIVSTSLLAFASATLATLLWFKFLVVGLLILAISTVATISIFIRRINLNGE